MIKKFAVLMLGYVVAGCAAYSVPVGIVQVQPAPAVVYSSPVVYTTSVPSYSVYYNYGTPVYYYP